MDFDHRQKFGVKLPNPWDKNSIQSPWDKVFSSKLPTRARILKQFEVKEYVFALLALQKI